MPHGVNPGLPAVPAACDVMAPDELEAAIAAHAERIAAGYVPPPKQCWACGRTPPARGKKKCGWRSRVATLPGIATSNHHGAVEMYCGPCFRRYGWPDWEDDVEEDEKYPPDLRLANCARCSRVLAAPDQSGIPDHLEVVAGRCFGRPHCSSCFVRAVREPRPPESRFSIPPQE